MRRCSDMQFHTAAKLRIYPSSEQKKIISVNDGASRFVYNRLTANDRDLHAMKKVVGSCPAYLERIAYLEQVRTSKRELVNTIPFLNCEDVDSLSVDNAIRNHNRAWKQFREDPGTGIPGFHKKGYAQTYQTNAHYKADALTWEDGNVRFIWRSSNEKIPHYIQLPKIGAIRFRCSPEVRNLLLTHRNDTRIGTITISRDNCGDYYAVLQMSSDSPFFEPLPRTGKRVGIDMNLTSLYMDSDGNSAENIRVGRNAKKKLAKAQRKLSRMAVGAKKEGRSLYESSNYQKQRLRTAKIQRQVSSAREDYLQVQTKRLVESQDLIVSEDLKVKNLMKNHCLAFSISDVSWSRFFTLLGQKAVSYGKTYIKVPAKNTTQTCSCCGHVMAGDETIPLGVEEWVCPACGTHHVRDHNAAINILERGMALISCG